MSIHVWICSLLATLSLVSYIAQLQHLRAKRYKTSTHLSYLVFNIFSAAEQANLCHWYSSQAAKQAKSCHDTYVRGARQWMCIFEMTMIWLFFSFAQFMTSVAFSSRSFKQKILLMLSYAIYASIIFVPFLFGNSRRTMAEIFTTAFPPLLLYTNPALIYLGYSTFFKRVPTRIETKATALSVLSLTGFVSQAMVHVILAFFWAMKVQPWSTPFTTLVWPAWIMSYNFFWWPMVDNAVLIAIQGRLFWIAIKGRKVVARESQEKVRDGDEKMTSVGTV